MTARSILDVHEHAVRQHRGSSLPSSGWWWLLGAALAVCGVIIGVSVLVAPEQPWWAHLLTAGLPAAVAIGYLAAAARANSLPAVLARRTAQINGVLLYRLHVHVEAKHPNAVMAAQMDLLAYLENTLPPDTARQWGDEAETWYRATRYDTGQPM